MNNEMRRVYNDKEKRLIQQGRDAEAKGSWQKRFDKADEGQRRQMVRR